MFRDGYFEEREPDFYGDYGALDVKGSEELRARGARLKETSDSLAEAARVLEETSLSASAGDLNALSFRVLEESMTYELSAAEAYAAEREEMEGTESPALFESEDRDATSQMPAYYEEVA